MTVDIPYRLNEPAVYAGDVVTASAPIRICDNGGWTDTWFASHGAVLNIAATPRINVSARILHDTHDSRLSINHKWSTGMKQSDWIAETIVRKLAPRDVGLSIAVTANVPQGSSTGTSAALCVALIGALQFVAGRSTSPLLIARLAHRLETEVLGLQSGVQDQIAAALGGINYIEVTEYPRATVTPLRLDPAVASELESSLSLVYVGKAHQSSSVHEDVIANLKKGEFHETLEKLRGYARDAKEALQRRDLCAFGRSLTANTCGQSELHPALVSERHWQIIDIARSCGALGWKVNGAGGNGGSVSILHDTRRRSRDETLAAIQDADPSFEIVPIKLSPRGLDLVHYSVKGQAERREAEALGDEPTTMVFD